MQQLTVGLLIADAELRNLLLAALRDLPVRIVTNLTRLVQSEELIIESELRRSAPDAVFVEISALGDRLPGVIGALRANGSQPAVIAIQAEPDSDALLAAVRAGAHDFLYPPLDEPALRQLLERIATRQESRQPPRPPAPSLGFLSATGGCGGSTLACHYAVELCRITDRRVLLADFDTVAGTAGFWMRTGNTYSIRDVAQNLHRLDASLWSGLAINVQPLLDVVPAPADIVPEEPLEPEQLLEILRFARSHYDWVVADLGPSLTRSSLMLLRELTRLYLVSTAEMPALYQARRVLFKLLSIGYPQERVQLVLSRVRKHQQVQANDVAQALGWPLEMVLPEDSPEVEEAHGEGRLISPKCDLAKRMAELAGRLAGPQPERKRNGLWSAIFRQSQPEEA